MEVGKKVLLEALADAGLSVEKEDGKYVYLEHNYLVEVEGESLFKLSEDGYVVAPFASVSELISFLLLDISESK